MLIVGYGSIGDAVERRLAGWEVTIDRVARHARDGVQPIGNCPSLRAADVVVILVPVTDETRQLVDAEFLRSMKDGALLVNAARGPIVDTDALLEELDQRRHHGRARRHRPRAAAAGPPAVDRRRACCSPRTSAAPSPGRATAPTRSSGISWPATPLANRC